MLEITVCAVLTFDNIALCWPLCEVQDLHETHGPNSNVSSKALRPVSLQT